LIGRATLIEHDRVIAQPSVAADAPQAARR